MADLAASVQHVNLELVAVTVAVVAGVQQETAEMAEVLVQMVVLVPHSMTEC